jgi:phosphatidylglycerophosphate synthase
MMRGMEEMPGLAGRRPLKSRASAWAGALSRMLVNSGVSANLISVFSVVFALGACAVLVGVGLAGWPHGWLLVAAGCVQSRLVCNLMDGMVAIEGGKKSATGDLFNEVPDRIADVAILAGAGFCALSQPWGIHLGWLAAALAVMTACIRMQGAALTGKHDFRGPMAKPQRMALITAMCVIGAFAPEVTDWFLWTLALMVAGEIVTLARRLRGIAAKLKG